MPAAVFNVDQGKKSGMKMPVKSEQAVEQFLQVGFGFDQHIAVAARSRAGLCWRKIF